jgi:hypothetical protein
MPIYQGTKKLNAGDLSIGGQEVKSAWLGKTQVFPDVVKEHEVGVYSFEGMYSFCTTGPFGNKNELFYSDTIYLTHDDILRCASGIANYYVTMDMLSSPDPNDLFEFTPNCDCYFLNYDAQNVPHRDSSREYRFSTPGIQLSYVDYFQNFYARYPREHTKRTFSTALLYRIYAYVPWDGTYTDHRIVDNPWIADNPESNQWLINNGYSSNSTLPILCYSRQRVTFNIGGKTTQVYLPKHLSVNSSYQPGGMSHYPGSINVELVRMSDLP